MKIKYKKVLLLFVTFSIAFPPLYIYGKESTPEKILTALILKVLNYDRSLDRRVNDELVIGIVFSSFDKEAKESAHEINLYINKLSAKFKVRNFSVRAQLFDYRRKETFNKEVFSNMLQANSVSAIYIMTQEEPILEKFGEITKGLKINSFSGSKNALKHGVAFGIVVVGEKPKLLINIKTTREEGSDYSARLLSLCEQVE